LKRLPVNVYRHNSRVVVTVPSPGLEPVNLRIEVRGRRLSMLEDARGPGQDRLQYVRREWRTGPARRAIVLPAPVDASRANATYDNGVLTVILPVAPQATPGLIGLSKVGTAKGQRIRHVGRELRPAS
jgi:HSP20 family protein